MDSKYAEVRSDFMPDYTSIDAWFSANDNEEGVVIACIYGKDKLEYLDQDARYDYYAQEVIHNAIEILKVNK